MNGIIVAYSYNDDCHGALSSFQSVYDANAVTSEFYLQQAGQIVPMFASQWFAISALGDG